MTYPAEKLGDLIESYIKDGLLLKEQIADICYHMEGGIEWNSAWGMSFEDREIVVKVINRRNKEKNPGGKDYI
jgi:hypothetical protein